MDLPAGLLPEDCNIEIFANPDEFGKCLFIQYGQARPFHELPVSVMTNLYHECFADKKAVKSLEKMGVNASDIVEHYNFCNRGRIDGIPDITPSGKTTKEFVDCGRRGKCPGEGEACSLMGLTFREVQCIRLNGEGKDYREIKTAMGFRSQTAVNSLMTRCRDKLAVKNKTQLLLKSTQLGII